MLSKTDIDIVKSTIPLLEEGGSSITEHFYERMFKHNPEVKHIFNISNQHNGRQKVALIEAIIGYAKNIENLSALKSVVEKIAHKHTSFNIQPEHYQIVGLHLIETLRELLGDIFTSDVEQAWLHAYQVLAATFINREHELYQSNETTNGGWTGKRAFKIIEKKQESALVTSFVFTPVDMQPVIDFKPGQYIGVEICSERFPYTEIRQYSLSDKPNGKSYRISVKKELLPQPGLVSNFLHNDLVEGDIVDLYPPAGDFFFADRNKPVVLISAGVGVTPMQAMLEYKAAISYEQPVFYLHACENDQQHSFKARTNELCRSLNWQAHTWYNEVNVNSEQNIYNGLMDFSAVDLPLDEADFYLCGPVGFMKYAKQSLVALGVAPTSVHYEVFGPHDNF